MCLVWAAGDEDGRNSGTLTNGMFRHLLKKKTCGDISLSAWRDMALSMFRFPRNTKFFFNIVQITVGRKEKG